MKPLTIVAPHISGPLFEKTLLSLMRSALVERVVIVSRESLHFEEERCQVLLADSLLSHKTLGLMIGEIQTKYLLLLPGIQPVSIEPGALEKMVDTAESTNAGMVYSDYHDENEGGKTYHPLNDYQPGSVRDDFNLGGMILFSVPSVRKALQKYGPVPGVTSAGLYDLRLKVSIDHPIHHLKEPLCTLNTRSESSGGEEIFAYVDPKNRAAQKEMEIVFTDYLKKIRAYLPPQHLREVEQKPESFLSEASIIIPVRNRKGTIADAVKNALSQKTDFPFNVIVVDNHSTDGTTTVLSGLASQYTSLKHIVPHRTDLGIGGCWNEAIQHEACGRYSVQLDSDDLYSSNRTLQKMVDQFRQGKYGMVIGSYTLVDAGLKEIPPGLIDHREWTDGNGHNNALRINGLGAPRGFDTRLMRKIGFLNVSYGEDYAAGLRICREYRIGRIYESLYLCRRWPGNTDANLTIEEANRNNAFKDKIRTDEILARQNIAKGIGHRVIPQKQYHG